MLQAIASPAERRHRLSHAPDRYGQRPGFPQGLPANGQWQGAFHASRTRTDASCVETSTPSMYLRSPPCFHAQSIAPQSVSMPETIDHGMPRQMCGAGRPRCAQGARCATTETSPRVPAHYDQSTGTHGYRRPCCSQRCRPRRWIGSGQGDGWVNVTDCWPSSASRGGAGTRQLLPWQRFSPWSDSRLKRQRRLFSDAHPSTGSDACRATGTG